MSVLRSLSSAAIGVIPAFAFLLSFPTQAKATNLIFSGSFSSSGIPAQFDTTPDPFSGTWEFEFDDSVVTGGFQGFSVPLTQLTLTPDVVGSTTFDLSNTSAFLVYNASGLAFLEIEGFPFESISGNNDDFSVAYDPATGLLNSFSGISISNADDNTTLIVQPDNVSGSFTVREATPVSEPVPEPLTILGAGTAVAFGKTFKRKLANAKKS